MSAKRVTNAVHWTVFMKTEDGKEKYHAEDCIFGELSREDVKAEGWEVIGEVSFERAIDAVSYCKQMDFQPAKKKRIRL